MGPEDEVDIDVLIADICKQNKNDEIIIRGSSLKHRTWQRVTTGSLGIDLALGGGWPLNSPNEIIGQPSSGKTTIAIKTIAANQAIDPKYHAVWVAAEDFDYAWAERLGMDLDRVTFVTTNLMEEVYEICLTLLGKRACNCLVIDSLPHLIPSDEWDKVMGDITVGRAAYVTNKFMRKATAATRRSLVEVDKPVLLLVVNQYREKIGGYGDPRTTPGGKGKDYAAVTRLEASRIEWLKSGDRKVGQVIKVHVIKNKSAPPQRTHEVDYYFEDAVGHLAGEYDTIREAWTIATTYDVIERKGAWYHFDNHKWNGKDKMWDAMRGDPNLVADLEREVRRFVLHQGSLPDVPPGVTEIKSKRRIKKAS
jgi:recombination protein RecA